MQSVLVAFRTVLSNFKTACLRLFIFLGRIVPGKAFGTNQSNLISHSMASFAS